MKHILLLSLFLVIFTSCKNNSKNDKINTAIAIANPVSTVNHKPTKKQTSEFKKYWYAGEAEITSYELQQARYGEIRKGKAVLIYVTEDFLSKEQVKADYSNPSNVPILKLNTTKKFNTGIYPYSIMQSTFYPIANNQHALKISSSMQEWCGHVYAQLNNRKKYEIQSHSYFQGEADENFMLDKNILENELWIQIRIAPDKLPEGAVKIIPSFEYSRLKHKKIKAYNAIASIIKEDKTNTYNIEYPSLQRSLHITFNNTFPYEIEKWSETFISGYGANAKKLTTTATKIKKIKSAYWSKNNNNDEILRKDLGL